MATDQQPPSPYTGGPYGPDPHGQYGNPYGNPYSNPYGGQYGNPYGEQYGNPYGGPYGYHPQPYHVVYVPPSGLAVASLVCSLVGFVTAGLAAIAGVICGHMALKETRSGQRRGHGLAIAGLIVGWLQCGFWLLLWVSMFLRVGVGAFLL